MDMYQKRKERQENKLKNDNEKKFSSVQISWYPGHMLKTKRQIIDDLKLIDVVIELLDARVPLSSQNPDIKDIIKNKKRIIILNKSDLAEEIENKKWIENFKKQGIIAICVDSNLGKGTSEVLKAIEKVTKEDAEKAAAKGRINKNIRVMILGITNVGKSSFINRICNKKSAQVGNRPGVTKQKQWVKISNSIELLDTPGVLWPKFENEKVALKLSYIGSIKDEILEKTQIAYCLLEFMYRNHRENLLLRYKLTEGEINSIICKADDKILELMNLIAKKRGAIISSQEIDYEKISAILLNDFREGKFGKITLEKADER